MSPPPQKPGRSKQDYTTPAVFITAVKQLLGISHFAHDFAADAQNTQATTFFDEATDALSVPDWQMYTPAVGSWGWLNPPFGHITP